MTRVFLFLILAGVSFAADTMKIRVAGTRVEGSPLTLELRTGSDILDVMAVVGGMTLHTNPKIMLDRGADRRQIDMVGVLCGPETSFPIQDGDVIFIPEHGTGYWQAFNTLLLERMSRRYQGLPLTDAWQKKATALYEQTQPQPR